MEQNVAQPCCIAPLKAESLSEYPGLVPAARVQWVQAIVRNLADIEDRPIALRQTRHGNTLASLTVWCKRVRSSDPDKSGRKRVLIVLFVPSVERDGVSTIDQPVWVDSALEMFGRVFGGATAFPKAKGIWRDDERGGTLVRDEPIVVHCYTTPLDIEDDRNLTALGDFCRRFGRETRQGEIGLVVGDEYFAICDFSEGAMT